MFLIQQVTDNPLQRQNLVLFNGATLVIEIYFRPEQAGWFFNSLVYKDFTALGLKIVNSPNLLRQWKNILPFGLACFSTANRDPSQAQDFSSGASTLYILTEDEVQEYESFLSHG